VGLKPATHRLLRQITGHPAARRPIAALAMPRLTVGTVPLRQWHGTTHRVTVLENGFEHGGQGFNSLSAIAHRIYRPGRKAGPARKDTFQQISLSTAARPRPN